MTDEALTDDERASLEEEAAEAAPKRRGRPPKEDGADRAGYVKVMVIAAGDGRISTGEHIAGIGDLTYARKDVFECPRPMAEALQARGFVEIE
jgi:hypothetical protein